MGEKKMELNMDWEALKRRIVGWMRDLILIFGMWCIWLVNKYVIDPEIKVIITSFLITIISITVLIREYFVTVDQKVISLERELQKIKSRS